jgi:hypothetical protein
LHAQDGCTEAAPIKKKWLEELRAVRRSQACIQYAPSARNYSQLELSFLR